MMDTQATRAMCRRIRALSPGRLADVGAVDAMLDWDAIATDNVLGPDGARGTVESAEWRPPILTLTVGRPVTMGNGSRWVNLRVWHINVDNLTAQWDTRGRRPA